MSTELEKMLYADWDHLSSDEWEHCTVEGLFEWPGGGCGLWLRNVEDIVIRVGRFEGDHLDADELSGVSEGLAGVIREAWKRGATWLHLDKYGEVIEGVPLCRWDEADEVEEEEEGEG